MGMCSSKPKMYPQYIQPMAPAVQAAPVVSETIVTSPPVYAAPPVVAAPAYAPTAVRTVGGPIVSGTSFGGPVYGGQFVGGPVVGGPPIGIGLPGARVYWFAYWIYSINRLSPKQLDGSPVCTPLKLFLCTIIYLQKILRLCSKNRFPLLALRLPPETLWSFPEELVRNSFYSSFFLKKHQTICYPNQANEAGRFLSGLLHWISALAL